MIIPEEIQSKIDTHVLAMPDFHRPFAIRMSTAGFCPRMMVYAFEEGKRTVSLESAMRLLTGEPIHDFYRKTMKEIYGDNFIGAEEEITLQIDVDNDWLNVPGHPDGMLKAENHIAEVKTVSDNTFTMVKNQGAPLNDHREQGNIYAHALKCDGVLFIYHNRDSGEYMVLVAPYSEDLARQTEQKWSYVERCRRAGLIPPRPYHDATAAPCWYCDHKTKCYEGYADSIAKGQAQTLEDMAAKDVATSYRLVRQGRLNLEKEEEGLKSELAKLMIERGLNVARLEWGEVTLKAGKNNNPIVGLKEYK